MAEINGGYCYYLLTNWDDPPSGVVWPVLVGRKVEEGLSWKAPQCFGFALFSRSISGFRSFFLSKNFQSIFQVPVKGGR